MLVPKNIDGVALERLLADAAKQGAREALASLGLSDESAAADLRELRTLLSGWRVVKHGALQTVGKYAAALLLGAIVAVAGFHLPGFGK